MNPNSLSVLETVEHLDLSRADALIQTLEAKIKSKPDDLRSLLLLGNTYYLLGQIGQSISHFEKVLAVNPQSAQAYYYLGVALYRSGRVDEAVQALSKVTQLSPSLVMAYYWLASPITTRGSMRSRGRLLKRCCSGTRSPSSRTTTRRWPAMADQAYEHARTHLEALISRGHRIRRSMCCSGMSYYRLNKINQAVDTYKTRLGFEPGQCSAERSARIPDRRARTVKHPAWMRPGRPA